MTDKPHQCVIIGIIGASASKKSFIARTLYRELCGQVGDEHIGIIPEDSYYKDQSGMTHLVIHKSATPYMPRVSGLK